MEKILVIGANGTVGSFLVKELENKGVQVFKATSREPKSQNELKVNLLTQEGLDKAMQTVDKLFLLCPPGFAKQHELLIPAIKSAKVNKIKKVVLMTAMGANAVEEAPLRQAEIFLEKSEIPHNIIRPNWFMQNFNTFWLSGLLADHKIYLPVENAKGSFIDARDIAAVAAKLLLDDKHVNKDFDLTGSESIDHHEVANRMTEVLKKTIQYQNISEEQMRQGLLSAGLPADYTEFLLMILNFFKLGYSERITNNVELILGTQPRLFNQYIIDYKETWNK